MEFKKYRSIHGVWEKKEMEYLRSKGFDHPSIEWCITEKVHGSNFAFYIDQDDIKIAKRTGFLQDGENFFQYLSMKESNGYKARNVWNALSEHASLDEIIIYGELFGGAYPHPQVEKIPNMRKIQKGVYYSPNINFYCFDIMVNGEFLNMENVIDLCEIARIFYAKILKKGTLNECLEYPNEFQSNIPKWLGLPLLDPQEKYIIKRQVGNFNITSNEPPIYEEKIFYGNICEGIVLKPIEPLFYENGNRVILKSKNEKFMEVSKEPKELRKQVGELSEFALETLEKIGDYINENRLRNVLSKFGLFKKKNFNDILGLFKKDIFENFNMDHDNLKNMEDSEKKQINKIINKACVDIWRPIFLVEAEREDKNE